MSKHRGGGDRPTRKSVQELTTIAKVAKASNPQPIAHLTQETQPVISPERLRLLRHFQPARLRQLLSQLLLVGEGRSRLSL